MKNGKSERYTFLIPVLYLIAAIVIVLIVARNGIYPSGNDVLYHVYRGDYIYNVINEGNLYPLYNAAWYNGVELLRYWPPLTAYISAACQALAGGSAMNGYLLFVGFIFFFGAISWFIIGLHAKRPFLGAFLGALWFFMPNNLYALFVEGNLPRSLCMVFLPLFIYCVINYLENRNWKYLPAIMGLMALQIMCHMGYAGMIALGVILYFIVYAVITGKIRPELEALLAMLIGFMLTGIWLIASLFGGITKIDSSESMAGFFQDAWITLNPFLRLESQEKWFYFGLAAFLLAIFGWLFGGKKSKSGFISALLIFILTTTSMYHVIKHLPGGEYLWMLRFISIALCMILLSLLYWKSLKNIFLILICALLVADVIPSLELLYGDGSGITVTDRLDEQQEATLIDKAQEYTNQRLALMDLSTLGATGAFLVSDWNDSVNATFGAGWEASVTATNISQLNRALEGGNYLYLFDRCKELGNDTVLVRLSEINAQSAPVTDLDAAAAANGYVKEEETTGYILYHLEMAATEGNWGTVTEYPAIGIGTSAPSMSLQFPSMEETASTNLNDYTFEELSKYELVYLAGFTYDDREYAENLVLDLSEAGVRVVIAADGIPEDRKTHDRSFLGVTCNTILFSNGYPELDTIDGHIYADLFPQGYTEWSTVYLEGLDDCWGTVYDNDLELAFYGTVKNENIVMIGINLTYHYSLTKDPSVGKLLSHAMDLSGTELPDRKIIPLTVEYGKNSITVDSPCDNVNTSLAYHDIFISDESLEEKNNLTYVNAGTTVIEMKYPYFVSGLILSVAGLLLAVGYTVLLRMRAKERTKALTVQ
ncbi:MAG: 6-pyruvoyl-tetrahydropterin synthase-related protein [Lachnospiraceae bacterium]